MTMKDEIKTEVIHSLIGLKSKLQGEIERIDSLLEDCAYNDERSYRMTSLGLCQKKSGIELAIEMIDLQIIITQNK